MQKFFASCAGGFEELLKQELLDLGADKISLSQGGLDFYANQHNLFSIILKTRLASRIFLPLAKTKIYSSDDLYREIYNINWQDYFDSDADLLVDFNGTNKHIRHSNFGALRTKDAVVDYFLENGFSRPSVSLDNPDIRIYVSLKYDDLSVSLDLTSSLAKRGWRDEQGAAPLRENVAAILLKRSGWNMDMPLVDPMCGSGTILIEAAQMAAGISANLLHDKFYFDKLIGFDNRLFNQIKKELKEFPKKHKNRWQQDEDNSLSPKFYGFDLDARVINIAKENAKRAGVADLIEFKTQDVANLTNPAVADGYHKCMLISNPPYGKRLGSTTELSALYTRLGYKLKTEFAGMQASILSSDENLLSSLRLRADRSFIVYNGDLKCYQKNYKVRELVNDKLNTADNLDQQSLLEARLQGADRAVDFSNRLKKNFKKLAKWTKQEQLDCYRLYDADLPDYNFAIDVYADYYVIQEYKAPATIDESLARRRFYDGVNALSATLDIPLNKIITKVRQKQKGKSQYEKLAQQGEYMVVQEYNAKFWVNLTDYLDTGLFLDHRKIRKTIQSLAEGKDFLNLFAYTGSASVHAALGGAKSTLTVDMSNTYLNWAEQNFILNNIIKDNDNAYKKPAKHSFEQADCLQWLEQSKQQFDLIFIDPPSFSNSKKMQQTFDVERDQGLLFTNLARILRPQGVIIFSNNKRGFKLDLNVLNELGLKARELNSISLDFKGNNKIHNSWQLEWLDKA